MAAWDLRAPHAIPGRAQIQADAEGDLVLFETGAIVLQIAERHAGLLPADPNTRSRINGRSMPANRTVAEVT